MRTPPALDQLKALWPQFNQAVHEMAWPRFTGCPPICTAKNLPSFESRDALKAFVAQNASTTLRMGKCDCCGGFHYEGKPFHPSGGSSGSERTSELPANFVPFVRKRILAQATEATAETGPTNQQTRKSQHGKSKQR